MWYLIRCCLNLYFNLKFILNIFSLTMTVLFTILIFFWFQSPPPSSLMSHNSQITSVRCKSKVIWNSHYNKYFKHLCESCFNWISGFPLRYFVTVKSHVECLKVCLSTNWTIIRLNQTEKHMLTLQNIWPTPVHKSIKWHLKLWHKTMTLTFINDLYQRIRNPHTKVRDYWLFNI